MYGKYVKPKYHLGFEIEILGKIRCVEFKHCQHVLAQGRVISATIYKKI